MAHANLTVDEEIQPKLKALRMQRKHQWLRIGMNEDNTRIMVLQEGAPGSTWDEMVAACPSDTTSFLVWDDKPTNKTFGIKYANDNSCTTKNKMVGSAAWIQLRGLQEANGVPKNFDCHDDDDLKYDNLSKKFK